MASTGYRGKPPHEGFLSSPITGHLRVKQTEERRKRAGYLYSKPKVGTYYQAKVPRYQSPSKSSHTDTTGKDENQQQTDRMDETIYRIENWKGDRRSKEYRELKKMYNEVLNSVNTQVTTTPEIYATSRNPICIHKPVPPPPHEDDLPISVASSTQSFHLNGEDSSSQDNFLIFARNLFLQSTDQKMAQFNSPNIIPVAATNANNTKNSLSLISPLELNPWLKNPCNCNDSSTNNIQQNGRKRKAQELKESDDEETESENTSTNTSINNDRNEANSNPTLFGLEQDELMLNFLQKHEGDENRAKISLMIHLSEGIAKKRKKRFKRYWNKYERQDDIKTKVIVSHPQIPPPPQSQLNDHTDEKVAKQDIMMLHSYPRMLGDLRSPSRSGKYKYHSNQIPKFPKRRKKKTHDIFGSDSEDDYDEFPENSLSPKSKWKLFLSMSNQIIKSTITTSSNTKKPRLRQVSSLLSACMTLDPPEHSISKESTLKKIDRNISALYELCNSGRDQLANLMDTVYNEDGLGVDLDKVKTCIQTIEANCFISLDEVSTIKTAMKEITKWEREVSQTLKSSSNTPNGYKNGEDNQDRNDLAVVEKLLGKSKALFFHSKSMVQLNDKIQRAHVLKRKIMDWKKTSTTEKTETIKFISSLVKEANKIGFMFSEIHMLNELHIKAEAWSEHAVRAVRYRISLIELLQVIEEGEKLPLNVTDQLEKLRSKADLAHDWIDQFREKVPCPYMQKINDPTKTIPDNFVWLERIRNMLNADDKEDYKKLLNLALEGARVPVDMEALRLLNLEMEARIWSVEAKRLLSTTGRSAKIDEFYAHMTKGGPIHDKAPKAKSKGKEWVLPFEKDLKATIEAADNWLSRYSNYFENNDEEEGKEALSHYKTTITELRCMVNEGKKLPVNLGSAYGKVSKMLARAEAWMDDYRLILVACGNKAANQEVNKDPNAKATPINLSELNAALDAASDLPIDLGDVIELRNMAERVKSWKDQAELIVPKTQTKRNTRGKCAKTGDVRTKHNLKELITLIEEASSLPNDIYEDLTRLKAQLSDVQSWRLQAQCDLREIITGFQILSVERAAFIAKEASKIFPETVEDKTSQFGRNPTKIVKVEISAKKVDMKVNKLVSILLDSTNIVPIYTIEESIAEFLTEVLTWCSTTSSVTPDEVLDKQVLNKLAVFIEQGDQLVKRPIKTEDICPNDITDLLIDLRKNWTAVVEKEQERLRNLEKRGIRFHEWVKQVEDVLSSTEKISLSDLQNYIKESHKYPTSIDLVRKVRKRGKLATAWVSEMKDILEGSSKVSLEEAKKIILKGDELGVSCPEVKSLRGHIRKSKAWALKVRKCSLEEGRTHIVDIKKLIGEHNDTCFLVTMPSELKTLKLAIRGYCLCRNPYEGFMIGCDGCDEWYHGLCVGISEVQADRCEKYLCIRCILSRNYKDCKSEASQILRKWNNKSELNKSRKHYLRNLQKRLKKAESDKIKWASEIESYTQNISDLRNQSFTNSGQELEESSMLLLGEHMSYSEIPNKVKIDGENLDQSISKKEGIEETIKKVQSKMQKAISDHTNVTHRLESLQKEEIIQKNQMDHEDQICTVLHQWFLKAGKNVLIPATKAEAKECRPNSDGTISSAMNTLVEEAIVLNISEIHDVACLSNIFKCLAWILKALQVLAKKPLQSEIELLIMLAFDIKLPNDKAMKFLRALTHRTSSWQAKVRNMLKPIPGETKPYNLVQLNELAVAARNIPMITSEEARLLSTIEDQGTRHCICGGPGDGTFMLSCDKCERWFHGACVGLDQSTAASIVSWECPTCSSKSESKTNEQNGLHKLETSDSSTKSKEIPVPISSSNGINDDVSAQVKLEEHHPWNDVSLYAPDPNELWPPFGLFGSSTAKDALGSDYGESNSFDIEPSVKEEITSPQQHQGRNQHDLNYYNYNNQHQIQESQTHQPLHHMNNTPPTLETPISSIRVKVQSNNNDNNEHDAVMSGVVPEQLQHPQNFHYESQRRELIPESATNTIPSYSYR